MVSDEESRRPWCCLKQACVWPVSVSPVPRLHPCVSSLALCLRCTCHLVWLHICGYPGTKPGQRLPLCGGALLRGTCPGFKHPGKKGSPLIVSTAKWDMLCRICLNIIYAHRHRRASALKYQGATTEEDNSVERCRDMNYCPPYVPSNREAPSSRCSSPCACCLSTDVPATFMMPRARYRSTDEDKPVSRRRPHDL